MVGNQPISFCNTSATWNMSTYFLFYCLGLRMDQKDCRNWSRKDRLTALESQTMTFKSFDVGAKVARCHKSEVFGGFFVMATSNIANRTKYTAFSVGFFVYLNFKELLLAVIWSFLMSVFGNSGVTVREGSKSIKIRQCNENLAIVDEWPLFRGAVIEEFHCNNK